MRGQLGPFAALRAVLCFGVALSAFSFVVSSAWAQFYVRSPEVDKGEAEIEEHGALYSGPGEDERLRQTHELEGKYGITERLEVIVEGVFEHPIGEDFEAEEIELGSQYEIVQREGDGFGLAFRTLYEFALQSGSPDEILFGPLAKIVKGRNSATINTFFVGQVGDHVETDSLELKVNWRLKHEFGERSASESRASVRLRTSLTPGRSTISQRRWSRRLLRVPSRRRAS